MADGSKGITAAQQFEFPNCGRLMCWAMPSEKYVNIENDPGSKMA